MKNPPFTAPAVLCAAGAALSFYGLWWLFAAELPPAAILALLLPLPAAALLHTPPAARLRRPRLRPPPAYAALLTGLAFFSAGVLLGITARRGADKEALVFPGLPPEHVTAVRGTLADDPRVSRSSRGIARLRLERAWASGGTRVSARGTILVFFPDDSLPRLKEFGRGSVVYIEGNFIPPVKSRGRPERGAQILFRAGAVHVTQAAGPVSRIRTALRLKVLSLFDEPWGGLAVALLLGIRDNLDTEFTKQYARAGCSYILALSGMHLAIISSVIAFLIRKPLGLKGAAIASSCFIIAYVYLAGAQPSLYRSALMYLLGAMSALFALPANGLILLALSFLIQIAADPLAGDSVSFILSYAALLGILLSVRPVTALFRGYIPPLILNPLSMSLAAFLATLSVSVFFFGEARGIGILASLLIAPLTTFFMIGSMAYLALGLIPIVKTAAGVPLNLMYLSMEHIATFAGKAPGLSLKPDVYVITVCVLIPVALTRAGTTVDRWRSAINGPPVPPH